MKRLPKVIYRVKTTIIENGIEKTNKPHNFEVTAVELMRESTAGRTITDATSVPASPTEFSATKLLNGVEKFYDPGGELFL